MSSADSEGSHERSLSPPAEESLSPKPPDLNKEDFAAENNRTLTPLISEVPLSLDKNSNHGETTPISLTVKSTTELPPSRGHPERKRRASDEASVDSSTTKASDLGTGDDVKEEDDDDDDESEEKLASQGHDPEKLKSFNMFVRLFVDENLDRLVPISKQPKDKIQAILEACDRQFPEFHDRSRKRIRTYLKSCRRMRRSKDVNGWESLRPTPPHLTSAAAESMLAQACENESNNAKRMRMGLEPLPAHVTNIPTNTTPSLTTQQSQLSPVPQPPVTPSQPHTPQPQPQPQTPQPQPTSPQSTPPVPPPPAQQPLPQSTPPQSQPPQLERQPTPLSNDYLSSSRHPPPTAAFRPPHDIQSSPFFANGNGLFRPGFPGYQHPAHHHPPVIQHTQIAAQLQNGENGGPTDLSMKKSQSQKNQLNPNEVSTIKQLIAGYRESAAFLYRSADELEQLLLQQN